MSKWKVAWKVFSFLFFDKRLDPIRDIVNEAEGFKVSGARKQPWAVNNVMSKVPETDRKDVALLIELALQSREA